MNQWRMAFRVGTDGTELWPLCKSLGIAAITHRALAETNLSKFPNGQPKERWDLLAPTTKFSLKAVAYEMKKGDVIYVKQGPMIICRGIVQGSYKFDEESRIVDEFGTPWPHQVPVNWERNFLPAKILLGAEQSTVKRFTPDNIEQLEKIFKPIPTTQK